MLKWHVHRFRAPAAFVPGLLVVFGLLSAAAAQERIDPFHYWPEQLKINGSIICCGGDVVPDEAITAFARAAGAASSRVAVLGQPPEDLVARLAAAELEVETVGFAGGLCELASYTGVWLAGIPDPMPEALETALVAALDRKAVVAAHGPAARRLARLTITGGERHATIGEGLDLIPDSVVEQAFELPGRRERLLGVLGSFPRSVGIGIDSGAAMMLRGRSVIALGSGSVTLAIAANERKPLRVTRIDSGPRSRLDLTSWQRDAIERSLPPFPAAEPEPPFVEKGTLMIVGGGGMPDGLMDQFIACAGGENAVLVYVPCTEADQVSEDQSLVQSWRRKGVKSAATLHTKDRRKANSDEAFLEPLKEATGIWFGGGRQWNLADSYYGTRAHQLMKDVLARGGVIAGSSAGASIQAHYMARGNPLGNLDIMAPGYERGLGFINGVAIDQHFTQRGRQADMTQLVDTYPQLLGIGIDERTAIVVTGSTAEVVGTGRVFFYNRNVPVVPGEPDYTALSAGSRYDLKERQVLETPAAEPDGDQAARRPVSTVRLAEEGQASSENNDHRS